ncbi:penicillin-binding protein 2 [Reinekea marinisedimentorum]|uniref:Peptidoglycan D,D-transpeptidase MrdA n=1 Tax=Reinekea marinisedimentorum TaxID=230495 RepID=A0A4R3I8Q2_9GAMM|nr:penicillin-binding protein 2 [Reinekea marinisedimentorum]TCS41679.1 penicillin-binding protein 2 [Reinekea marinisedimentorum]
MTQHSLDTKELERRIFKRRMIVSAVVVVLMLMVLVSRLVFLQVVEHEKHQALSDNNRLEVVAIPPTRGLIYDRNGELLAENLPSHTLSIVVERAGDIDQLLDDIRDVIEVSDDQVSRFKRRLKQYRRPYDPVPLKIKLTEDEIAALAANRIFLKGVQVEAELIRQYPQGEAFAHVLGYVGRINEQEAENLDKGAYAGIRFIGKQGIEKQYEDVLLGKTGYQRVETNARGRVLKVLEKQAPVPGANIHLQLDSALQKKAFELLDGKRGSVVAIEPETGGILALVSQPSFDPNLYVTGFPTVLYNELRDSPDKPFLNRATRGQYPAASTIKPFIGLAGVDGGFTTWSYTINDNGWFQLPNDDRIYRDWKRGGHGIVNLTDAIEESVDTYFYELAYRMTLEPIHDMLDEFGFGKITTLDVYNSANGNNPSRQWKKDRHGFSWYAGDTVNLGIGQGYMLVTPTQLAIATGVLANHGRWFMPRLLMHSNDESLLEFEDKAQPDIKLNDDSNWSKMDHAMTEVMYGRKGTARRAGYQSQYTIAGKTGTAQVAEIKRDEEGNALDDVPDRLKDHAWFMAYAPVEDPKIALVVLVENGGGGSTVAAPIARELLDEYLLRESVNAQ